MGLDVGVVNIKYIDAPAEPARGFLFDLAGGDLNEGWIGGWDGNVFLQILREDLQRRAAEYASARSLSRDDVVKLLSWVETLPWEREDVMLHLSW